MKKLSIIVPVYNSQKYLRRCIESVVNQMREWVELIIVDDGSTDDSPYICDEYKMIDNISVIHKKNGGLSSARNAGLEIATGDYVFFLDSDDLIDGSLINDLGKYFDEDWDFLNFGYCFEKEENQFNPKGSKNTKILNQMEFIDLYCKNRYGNQICFRIYKKELFEKFGIEKFAEVKIADLSTGMKQKVSIVISIVHDPDVIIFDEPTNGLDVITAKVVTDFLKELKSQNKIIIISTHIFSLVEKLCDRVGIIINGKMIKSGELVELTKEKDLEELFFELYKEEVGEK